MTKKLKKQLARIIVAIVIFVLFRIVEFVVPKLEGSIIWLPFYLALYIFIAHDIVKKAILGITHLQYMDENFLMTLASVGAFFIGSYSEGVAVIIFYQVGEWFQSYAVGKSRKSIKDLMNIRPDYANVIREGKEEELDPEDVSIDEIILIKPSEKIPLDGEVINGVSSLDTKALTGESLPRDVETGDMVISGCVNLSGVLKVRVTKEFAESTVSKILRLVEEATDKKSESENFITKFAKWYTPTVVLLSLTMVIVPSILTGQWQTWLYRALSFLVISCPCALVISIPLSFFGGIGGAGKDGILVKGSCFIEELAKAEIVAMDKTGTLTKGSFEVSNIVLYDNGKIAEKNRLLEIAALAESFSLHPIGLSLVREYLINNDLLETDKSRALNIKELAGRGIEAHVDGNKYYVGNKKLLNEIGIACMEPNEIGTIVYVADTENCLGYIVISDRLKEDSKACIDGLKSVGIKRLVMLTGDGEKTANYVAKSLGIEEYYSGLLPADKVDIVEKLMSETSEKGKLIFVGDGINDAPVLARADIGIAMGGLGSDAAIEAADIVIMTDEPSKIAKAMKISRKTLRIVKENIIFAIGIKVAILILAAFGIASMWAAVFADVGVAFIAILNAMRALRTR